MLICISLQEFFVGVIFEVNITIIKLNTCRESEKSRSTTLSWRIIATYSGVGTTVCHSNSRALPSGVSAHGSRPVRGADASRAAVLFLLPHCQGVSPRGCPLYVASEAYVLEQLHHRVLGRTVLRAACF